MTSLVTRVISALIAVTIISISYYFYHLNALKVLCFVAVCLGTRELLRLLFAPKESVSLRTLCSVLVLTIFSISAFYPEWSALCFSLGSIIFVSCAMVYSKRFEDLQSLSLFASKSILGFFYLGLLPSYAFRLLLLPNGLIWFVGMLAIVFTGDTFAYIFGILWGKKKMLPLISPKKTIMGSFGGLFGSILAGLGIAYWLKSDSYLFFVLLSLITGITAQLGDLFESLLKRVANKKDSGSIMPGHGGVLDRLDGVFFAAPVVLAGAEIFGKLFQSLL